MAAYFDAYPNLAMSRSGTGVLMVRFHTDGGPAVFSAALHAELQRALHEIAEDRDNRVLVLTGTGDRFMGGDGDGVADGQAVMQQLADLEMPIVAAVNGPVSVHSEYALLADIVVAADTTMFADQQLDVGLQVVWEEAIGLNRTRYLTLTHGSFSARQAHQWGAIAEVLPPSRVFRRATELAEALAAKPQPLTRYLAVTLRRRVSRRLAEGLKLEGLTAADMAYQLAPSGAE
jgi:enoyl-CoA hydratase/carnithine racemase